MDRGSECCSGFVVDVAYVILSGEKPVEICAVIFTSIYMRILHGWTGEVQLPLVSEVIQLLITIVGEILKSEFKYARGKRHSVKGGAFILTGASLTVPSGLARTRAGRGVSSGSYCQPGTASAARLINPFDQAGLDLSAALGGGDGI